MVQSQLVILVVCDEEKILGKTLNVENQYKFIKPMFISCGVDVLHYHLGHGA